MIPVLTREAVEPLLDWIALTEALRAGHRRPAAQIEDVLLARRDDRLLSRAAWIDGMGVGVKSVTVVPGNAARGLPSIHGAMLIFNDTTGEIEAVIDNALITRWKTAGDSLLGARLLARPDAERYLIIGAGSVVSGNIPDYTIVAGNPARVIRPRFDPATIAEMLQIAWWDWDIDRIVRHEAQIVGVDIAALQRAADKH